MQASSATAGAAVPARWRVVTALGLVQIFAWGSTYYLMAVLAGPVAADTGWSAGLLSAGVSLGLLVSGLAAPAVGRRIGARGGRGVLAAGVTLIAAGLALLGAAPRAEVYLLAWGVIGLGMAAALYDAAFSTLGRIYGQGARRPITQLTLWGGFASTVGWPATAWLSGEFGWRGACFAWAAFHLAVTLPLVASLPRAVAEVAPAPPGSRKQAPPAVSDPRFLCIVAAGVTLSVTAAVVSVHLVTLLAAQGLTVAAAVGLGALIGPAQVGARLLEVVSGGKHHPLWTMAASVTLVLSGFAGLWSGIPAAWALVAYGAGNGLWSIARGSLPLTLFGAEAYAATMGRLALPMVAASAAAPLLGAAAIATLGPQGTLTALALAALVPCTATLVLALLLRRR